MLNRCLLNNICDFGNIIEKRKVEAEINKTRLAALKMRNENVEVEEKLWPAQIPSSDQNSQVQQIHVPPELVQKIEPQKKLDIIVIDDTPEVPPENAEVPPENAEVPPENAIEKTSDLPGVVSENVENSPKPPSSQVTSRGIEEKFEDEKRYEDAELELEDPGVFQDNEIEFFKGPDLSNLPKEIPIPYREGSRINQIDYDIDLPADLNVVESLGKKFTLKYRKIYRRLP